MFLQSIFISKLYDQFDYTINFDFNDSDYYKILTAPNGFGKSTVLRIIFNFFNNNLNNLMKEKFNFFVLKTIKGEIVVQKVKNHDVFKLEIKWVQGNKNYIFNEMDELSFNKNNDKFLKERFPFLVKINEEKWIDTRDDEILFNFEVKDRYSHLISDYMNHEGENSWFYEFIQNFHVDLIDANRLYTDKYKKNNILNNAVSQLSDEIREKIYEVHRQHYNITMSQQSLFPNKVLNLISSEGQVESELIVGKINEILNFDRRYNEDKIFGDLGFDYGIIRKIRNTNDSFLLVLNEYLDDILVRVSFSLDLAKKIQKFIESVNSLLMFKKIEFNNENGLVVRKVNDENQFYHIEELSSGEQHIIILFGRLIFDTIENSLVLIDEPEISLHAAWQKQLMALLTDIAKENNINIIVATHSFMLINGDWDKTIELAELYQ